MATWNVLGGPDTARRTLDGVLASNADLIALVELQPAAADALSSASSVKSRLPYQVLAPDPGFLGTGLLSRYPVLEQKWSTDPSYLRAVVDVPGLSKPIVVYVVHPLPAITQTAFDLPVGLDTSERDRSLALIHATVAADVAADQTVLAAGDFNTTEREPAYSLFVRGMRDAHLDAGIGPGLTWRPSELEGLPFGLIRIDYLLTTPDLRAVSTHVVCGSLSDHCLLEAALR